MSIVRSKIVTLFTFFKAEYLKMRLIFFARFGIMIFVNDCNGEKT